MAHLNTTNALPNVQHPGRAPTGATVLVRTAPASEADTTRYRSGMISDADDEGGAAPSYGIIYDDSATDQQEGEGELDDEEDGVAAGRVLGVPASPCVWCAARLNLARCSFRREKHDEARAAL